MNIYPLILLVLCFSGIASLMLAIHCAGLRAENRRLRENLSQAKAENTRLTQNLQQLQEDVAKIPTLRELVEDAERFFDHVYQRH